jgi:hypothetical protein
MNERSGRGQRRGGVGARGTRGAEEREDRVAQRLVARAERLALLRREGVGGGRAVLGAELQDPLVQIVLDQEPGGGVPALGGGERGGHRRVRVPRRVRQRRERRARRDLERERLERGDERRRKRGVGARGRAHDGGQAAEDGVVRERVRPVRRAQLRRQVGRRPHRQALADDGEHERHRNAHQRLRPTFKQFKHSFVRSMASATRWADLKLCRAPTAQRKEVALIAGALAAAALALLALCRARRVREPPAVAAPSARERLDALVAAASAELTLARERGAALGALGEHAGGGASAYVDADASASAGDRSRASSTGELATVASPPAVRLLPLPRAAPSRLEIARIGSTDSIIDLATFSTPPEGDSPLGARAPPPPPPSVAAAAAIALAATAARAASAADDAALLVDASGARARADALARACDAVDATLGGARAGAAAPNIQTFIQIQPLLARLNSALPATLVAEPAHAPTLRALAAPSLAATPEPLDARRLRETVAAALVRVGACRLELAAAAAANATTAASAAAARGTRASAGQAELDAARAARAAHVCAAVLACGCAASLDPSSAEAHSQLAWAHLAAADLPQAGGKLGAREQMCAAGLGPRAALAAAPPSLPARAPPPRRARLSLARACAHARARSHPVRACIASTPSPLRGAGSTRCTRSAARARPPRSSRRAYSRASRSARPRCARRNSAGRRAACAAPSPRPSRLRSTTRRRSSRRRKRHRRRHPSPRPRACARRLRTRAATLNARSRSAAPTARARRSRRAAARS